MKLTKTSVAPHSSHYRNSSGYEPIDAAELMPFNQGQVLKYLVRRNRKHDSPLVDLEKAHYYAMRERQLRRTAMIPPMPVSLSDRIQTVLKALAKDETRHVRTAIHYLGLAATDPYNAGDHLVMVIATIENEIDDVKAKMSNTA